LRVRHVDQPGGAVTPPALATQAVSPAAVAAAQAQAAADNQATQAEVAARSAALDELLAAPDSTPGAIAAARADLASAQANVESVRLAGEGDRRRHAAAVQATTPWPRPTPPSARPSGGWPSPSP
jgi:hypothetical protein